MVRECSTLTLLAATAAFLAHLVVPLTEVKAEPTLPASSKGPVSWTVDPPTVTAPLAASQERDASRDVVPASAPSGPATNPQNNRRVRVPVGCERVVSGLVRSAAATQIARCLT